MSGYFPDDKTMQVGSILYSPTTHDAVADAKSGSAFRLIDTAAVAQRDAQGRNLGTSSFDRPTLPPAQSQLPQNDMMVLAEAFVETYTSMSNSVITQTKDYTGVQQLVQTQSQAVLTSTTDAINQQEAAAQEASEISNYEKSLADAGSIVNDVLMGLGALVMILSVASVVAGAATVTAAVTEGTEMEMTDLASSGLADTENLSETEINLDEGTQTTEGDGVNSDEDASATSENNEIEQQTRTQNQQTQENEQTSKDLQKSNEANAKSVQNQETVLQKIGNFSLKMAITGIFGTPQLIKGVTGFTVGSRLNSLAAAQLTVGSGLSTVQENNMYYQFLQQFLQREGGVLQEEASDANEVIDTFSSVTSSWRSISYGLASAA